MSCNSPDDLADRSLHVPQKDSAEMNGPSLVAHKKADVEREKRRSFPLSPSLSLSSFSRMRSGKSAKRKTTAGGGGWDRSRWRATYFLMNLIRDITFRLSPASD